MKPRKEAYDRYYAQLDINKVDADMERRGIYHDRLQMLDDEE